MSGHGAWSGQSVRTQRTESDDTPFGKGKTTLGSYGINVSEELRGVKYSTDAMDGAQWMLEQFPHLRGHVTDMVYDADYPAMAYSQSRWGDDGLLKGTIALTRIFDNGDRAHNRTDLDSLRATGAHEMAHALADAMRNRAAINAGAEDKWARIGVIAEDIQKRKFEHSVIDPAIRKLRRTTGMGARELRRGISGYATTNYGETFAEAMGDYFARGESAAPLSVEIFHNTRKALGLE